MQDKQLNKKIEAVTQFYLTNRRMSSYSEIAKDVWMEVKEYGFQIC